MPVPKFSEKELEIIGEVAAIFGPPIPLYNFPVTPREACIALYNRKAVWQIAGMEQTMFCPGINPDNVARAFVFEANALPPEEGGGKDIFGIEWEYIPQARGSMVRPGKPLLNDANAWYDKLVWPDIDSWAWERSAKANETFFLKDRFSSCMIMNGWYERLISFMDFEGAAVAMIDEDQKQAVKDLFNKLSDLYIRMVDKYLTYYPAIDIFCIHDDWGSQKETFFSPDTVREMIVPYMKRVTDYIHSRGRYCDLHSCGQILRQVPNIIAAGWDSWIPQEMNDSHKIYELYGDKLIVAVMPDNFDYATASEEEQRDAARAYANRFCVPDKPSTLSHYAGDRVTPAFREELYKASRINYEK